MIRQCSGNEEVKVKNTKKTGCPFTLYALVKKITLVPPYYRDCCTKLVGTILSSDVIIKKRK